MSTLTRILLLYYLIINVVLFSAMRIDKHKAEKGKMRIPEATLFIMSLLGGAIGGLAGMKLFSHKTKKPSFYAIYILSLILHIAFVMFLFRVF